MIALFRQKSRIEDRENALVISNPLPKVWFTTLLLFVWLIASLYGLVMAWQSLLRGKWVYDANVFNRWSGHWNFIDPTGASFWLCFWIGLGFFSSIVLSRLFFGREIVSITTNDFKIKQDVFGIGNSQKYDRKYVTGLRFNSTKPQSILSMFFTLQGNLAWYGFLPGSIAFDYGARTIRFAAGLDEAQARSLVEKIKERFPEVISDAKDNSRFVPR